MTDRTDVRNEMTQVRPVSIERDAQSKIKDTKILEKLAKLEDITLTVIKRDKQNKEQTRDKVKIGSKKRRKAKRHQVSDWKAILYENQTKEPISPVSQSESIADESHVTLREHKYQDEIDDNNSRANELGRYTSSLSSVSETKRDTEPMEQQSRSDNRVDTSSKTIETSTSSEAKYDETERLFDRLKDKLYVIRAKMSSDQETSTTDSEDYREIEREIDKFAKTLEEASKKRTLREPKEKLKRIRQQIERRMKRDDEKNKGKIERFASRIKQKDKFLSRKRKRCVIRHEEETKNSEDENVGDIRLEIEIKENIRRRKKMKIIYEVEDDKVRRRVKFTDRSTEMSNRK